VDSAATGAANTASSCSIRFCANATPSTNRSLLPTVQLPATPACQPFSELSKEAGPTVVFVDRS
jgi:hypothetical protein